MSDPLKPSVSLLVKLGSIAVHADEGVSALGHPFDIITIKNLLADSDVQEWFKEMDAMALLPKKRNDRS